jgi:hypothetical protein
MSAHDLLKKVKDDYDRLAEVSPPLPDESIAYFKTTYKSDTIAKPEEANGLTEILIHKELKIRIPIESPAPTVTPAPVPTVTRRASKPEDAVG